MSKIKEIVKNKKLMIIIPVAVLAVAIVAVIACTSGGEGALFQGLRPVEVIQSKYVKWSVPKEYTEILKYEYEENGDIASDMFSLQLGDKEVPVFRFDFGDENAGDWLGVLTVGEEQIPVVYTVFMMSDEELAAAGDTDGAYYKLMDLFNQLVKDFEADKNFSTKKPVMVSGSYKEVALTYWTVTLPEEMHCSESNENGTYQALFYGDIHGEKVALYQVNIGDEIAETELGFFQVDGQDKVVSIKVCDIFNRSDWNDDDYAVAYLMVDTINTVIEQITSSELFFVPSEEP